mgnify:CR=1 FL=1
MEKIQNKPNKGEYSDFPCDVCGSTKTIEVPNIREYTNGQVIHICKKCGFIYVIKRRSFDKIAEIWSKDLFGKNKKYTAKSPLMLARHTYVAQFMESKIGINGKSVFDIGAGEGQFLSILKEQYNSKVFGIEPSDNNCTLMDGIDINNFIGTAEDYLESDDSKNNKADFVTILWTLEASTNPKELLNTAHEILNDGGRVVIGTGSRVLVPFSKPLYLYFSTNPVDSHPSRFSFNTLSSLLKVCGFEVEHVNPYLNDILTMCVIAKKVEKKENVEIIGDDYEAVKDYFIRWQEDTKHYL